LPDSFYYSAQKIINDPNFDTLHFQLLWDVYRHAPAYQAFSSEQQNAFNDIRDELLEHVWYLGLQIPNPGKA
jgi:hypothetical protein